MHRRHFLATALAATALPRTGWAAAGGPAYLAAARAPSGAYRLHGLAADGAPVFALPLPARGHAAAAHPARAEAVAFACRPGTFALVIDCAAGSVRHRLTPPEGRQFNGHGAFSADGGVLFTSEVVAETSEGRIGLWDAAAGYVRAGEIPSHGIGPHDLRRLPGSDRLVVANGGIRTDPADRRKLNLDGMRPNLAYVAPDGSAEEIVELPPDLAQASIRHLALGPDGLVAFAMQWEGDPAETVPLLGLHRRGAAPRLCAAPDTEAGAMRGYAGSIALDPGRGLVALTSPPGGVVQVFGLADGRLRATHHRQDASGIAAGPDGFLVTDGGGGFSLIDAGGLRPLGREDLGWDNHLVAIG